MNVQTPLNLLYPRVTEAFENAHMLPSEAYIDPAWYAREKVGIFGNAWVVVGRAEQIPNAGDYFTCHVTGQCVLLARGEDGQVRAFSPSCRHRGALIAEGEGNKRAFVCPYHRWTYGLDGSLIGAPGMDGHPNFDKADFPLAGISCAVWQGFIFINLSDTPSSLEDDLADLAPIVEPYRLADMRLARTKTYTIKANWKSYIDNSIEAYHVASVHARSLQPVAPMSAWQCEPHEHFYLQWAEFAGTLGVLKGEEGFPPMPGFSLDQPARHILVTLLPNTVLTMTVDAIWWITLLPLDVNTSTLVVNHAFPVGTRERPDYEAIAERYFRRFDVVSQEDIEITEIQQRGITHGRRIPGLYQEQERLVHAFAGYVLRTLDRSGA